MLWILDFLKENVEDKHFSYRIWCGFLIRGVFAAQNIAIMDSHKDNVAKFMRINIFLTENSADKDKKCFFFFKLKKLRIIYFRKETASDNFFAKENNANKTFSSKNYYGQSFFS